MMATVAILLSLVLITTSIVSTTFAKYVSQKRVDGSFDIDAFGVTVGMELSDEFKAAINSDYAGQTDDKSITLTLNNMKLKPGDSYLDAVKLSVSGTPSVDVLLTIDVDIIYDSNQFTVTGSAFDFDSDMAFFPVGFKYSLFGSKSNSLNEVGVEPWVVFSHSRDVECSLVNGIGPNLDGFSGKLRSDASSYMYRTYSKGTPIKLKSDSTLGDVNQIGFGFHWPNEWNETDTYTNEQFDAIGTWLTINKNPSFTLTYAITVEQIPAQTT